MFEGFDKLTSIERQDAFLDMWVSADGIEFAGEEAKAAYKERAGLVASALKIDQGIKRVPIMPLTTFAPTMLAGVSGRDAMYDPDKAGQAYVDFCNKYQPDTAGAAPMLGCGQALDTLDYHLYKWPGHGVAENLSYQFNEKEYMKAEEYDHLINDPTDFWLRSWIPKTMGALAPWPTCSRYTAAWSCPCSAHGSSPWAPRRCRRPCRPCSRPVSSTSSGSTPWAPTWPKSWPRASPSGRAAPPRPPSTPSATPSAAPPP